MTWRYLSLAIATAAVLGVAGCHSCRSCGSPAPAVSSAPPCESCGNGAPLPPPPVATPAPLPPGQGVYYHQ
jgi:hypothetical protein